MVGKAYIYIRVSSEEQVSNNSLDTQEKTCRDYCQRENIDVVRVFRDEGESAKTMKRSQLKMMLDSCVNAKKLGITHVVIFKSDRIARNVNDYSVIGAILRKNGITLVSPLEAFDDTASGKLYGNILASFAQYDNDARSERTKMGMIEGLNQGQWMWRAPVGYRRGLMPNEPSLVIDAELKQLIEMGFVRVSQGVAKDAVLRELTSLGLRTKAGRKMSKQSFNELLRNPLYAGRVVSKKLNVDRIGDFEPIVSEELFNSVQEQRTSRKSNAKQRNLDNPDFPLRRWVQCGECLTPMTGSWSTGRPKKYPYYHCRNKDCQKVNVRKEYLETLFIELLDEKSVAPQMLKLMEEVVREMWKERHKLANEIVRKVEKQIEEMKLKQDRLMDLYISGKGITEDQFVKTSSDLEREMVELRLSKDRESIVEVDIDGVIEFAQSMLLDLPKCWNRLEPQRRPQFLRAMIPNGATYSNGVIGTVESPWFVMGLNSVPTTNAALAPPTGFEPVPPP